ncbi:MAG: hypothetical protein DPW14_03670 [Planctomycetes bacterium]|nr:hypothetical protein [Planctomycetota bacterium]RIK61939.1 MAG: hypothetical protein DCC64_11650 [Planctomycetota bacterium]
MKKAVLGDRAMQGWFVRGALPEWFAFWLLTTYVAQTHRRRKPGGLRRWYVITVLHARRRREGLPITWIRHDALTSLSVVPLVGDCGLAAFNEFAEPFALVVLTRATRCWFSGYWPFPGFVERWCLTK